MHDTWSMILQKWRHQRALDALVMAHHVGLIVLLPLYLLYEKGDFYVAAVFLQNASTPLLHGRYMLLKSEMKGCFLHKGCAIMLLVVFFAVRILLWPCLFVGHSYNTNTSILDIHRHVRSYCLITAVLMSTMNMAWWLQLVTKVMKIDMKVQFDPRRTIAVDEKPDSSECKKEQ